MSPETTPESIEAKYSSGLTEALGALADALPDRGKDRPDWSYTRVFETLQKAVETAGRVIRDPIPWLTLVTFGFNPVFNQQVAQGSGRLLEVVTRLNQVIANEPAGREILRAIQTFVTGPFPFGTSALIGPEKPPLVNFALLLGGAAQVGLVVGAPIRFGVERWRGAKRRERMEKGIEPLRREETPGNVMIGSAEFLSTVARIALAEGRDFSQPDVIVHAEGIEPPAFGIQVEYHFDVSGSSGSITSKRFRKESGIDRAKNLFLVAFDPDHALFYGREAASKITPSMFSTLIAFLSQEEEIKNKNILVIAPRGTTFLTQTTSQHELFGIFKKKGVRIEVLTPEDVILGLIKEDVEIMVKKKSENEKIKICLVGGADTEMLKRFKKGIEEADSRVEVKIISDELLGDLDPQQVSKLSDEEKAQRIEDLLKGSDINYVYGDNDNQSTDLANLVIERRKAEKSHTVCILEREESIADTLAFGLFYICVYRKLAEEVGQRMRK